MLRAAAEEQRQVVSWEGEDRGVLERHAGQAFVELLDRRLALAEQGWLRSQRQLALKARHSRFDAELRDFLAIGEGTEDDPQPGRETEVGVGVEERGRTSHHSDYLSEEEVLAALKQQFNRHEAEVHLLRQAATMGDHHAVGGMPSSQDAMPPSADLLHASSTVERICFAQREMLLHDRTEAVLEGARVLMRGLTDELALANQRLLEADGTVQQLVDRQVQVGMIREHLDHELVDICQRAESANRERTAAATAEAFGLWEERSKVSDRVLHRLQRRVIHLEREADVQKQSLNGAQSQAVAALRRSAAAEAQLAHVLAETARNQSAQQLPLQQRIRELEGTLQKQTSVIESLRNELSLSQIMFRKSRGR